MVPCDSNIATGNPRTVYGAYHGTFILKKFDFPLPCLKTVSIKWDKMGQMPSGNVT